MKGIAITTAAAACCLAVTTANKLPSPTSSTFGIGRATTFARGGAVGKFFQLYLLLYCFVCVAICRVSLQWGRTV